MLTFAGLALLQIAAVSFLFYFPTALAEWSNPVAYAKKLAQLGVLACVLFALVAWPRRGEILGRWSEATDAQRWHRAVLANLGIFIPLALATVAFSRLAAGAATPPWSWFWAYCRLLLVNAVFLALIAAPKRFWAALPRLAPIELGLAGGGALLVLLAGELAKESWSLLAAGTLRLAGWLLTLYEHDVIVDVGQRILGVGAFRTLITPECSGYEGIGLVVTFLSLYLWIFRSHLRFPNAVVLLPVGIVAIWSFNAARIAALVSIGAHWSPAVAAGGFHSQAGWIGFLIVTVGMMVIAHRSAFFSNRPAAIEPAATGSDRELYALLLPFIALLAAGIVAAAFVPHDRWLYGLKLLAVGTVLWAFLDVYLGLTARVSVVSVLAGFGVGGIWIVTDPGIGQPSAIGSWLYGLPPAAAAAWVAMRAIGSVVVVPIAEELAFRGYLHRALIARRFETVAQGQFTWLAFIVSSLAFGLMHRRWLAGALAGATYALLMYRTGRLSDAIAAHMASNAAIVLWAAAMGQWSLL